MVRIQLHCKIDLEATGRPDCKWARSDGLLKNKASLFGILGFLSFSDVIANEALKIEIIMQNLNPVQTLLVIWHYPFHFALRTFSQ